MPGLFSRLKTWVANEVLVYSDLNAEFDNIISNLEADTLGGYSATVAQMRSQVNPGSVGSESQASSISGELERIRFVISRIIGKTYWYDTPARSLQNFIVDPRHLFAPQNDFSSTGDFASQIAEAIDAGIFDMPGYSSSGAFNSTWKGGQGKFAAFSLQNGPTSTNAHLYRLDSGRLNSGNNTYSFWFKNFGANDTIFENPFLNLRLYVNGSGFLVLDIIEYSVSGANKTVRTIATTSSVAGSASYKHVLMAYSIKADSSDSAALYLDGVLVGILNGPIKVKTMNTKNSPVFLCGSYSNNPTLTTLITQNNNLVPGSNGWTVSGTGSDSVSDGILTTITPAGGTRIYSRTDGPSTNASQSVWYEAKFRIVTASLQASPPTSIMGPLTFHMRLGTSQFAGAVTINGGTLTVGTAQAGVAVAEGPAFSPNEYTHDFSQWTRMTVVYTPSPQNGMQVYINGKLVATGSLRSDTTAGSLISFGKLDNNAPDCTFEMDYFRAGNGNRNLFPNNSTTQEISDFVAIKGYQVDPNLISALASTSPLALFGSEKDTKITEQEVITFAGQKTVNGGAADTSIGQLGIYSNGRRPTNIQAFFSGKWTAAGTSQIVGFSQILNNVTSQPFDSPKRANDNDNSTSLGGSLLLARQLGAVAANAPFGLTLIGSPVLSCGLNTIDFKISNITGGANATIYRSTFVATQN